MRRGIATAVAVIATLALAAPANATFHLMKIKEVGNGATSADYVVLQMYAGGQNQVAGKVITTYMASGLPISTFTFPTIAANADSQRTIYVARNDGTPLGTPDFLSGGASGDLAIPQEGAVCFGASVGPGEAVDCMSFGGFTGFMGGAPSPTGTPAVAMPPGTSLGRTIAPGCATLLEAGDDTDNSAADFAPVTPAPRNNATAPTETACAVPDADPPQTTITKQPKSKSTKRKAKIKFKSDEQGSEFGCRLDGGEFEDCSSPFKAKVDFGKHKFQVYAIDPAGNADPSPAKAKFKRVRD